MTPRRGNKFGARKTRVAGRTYDSGLEAEMAVVLAYHLEAGRLASVKPQHKLLLKANGKLVTTHVVDFLVTFPDGRKKYVEVKGFPTREWAIKRKLVEATDPIPYLVNPTDRELFA